MRLCSARIQEYRSIRDTGWFDVEPGKTIMVGPNEAGKTAVLEALQRLNPPADVPGFDPLRDYPRSEYNDITTGRADPKRVQIVSGKFTLEKADIDALPPGYDDAVYVRSRYLDNHVTDRIEGGPSEVLIDSTLTKDLARMAAHADKQYGGEPENAPSGTLAVLTGTWKEGLHMTTEQGTALRAWLDTIVVFIDESNGTEERRHDRLVKLSGIPASYESALSILHARMPVFVLFNNYYRVRPLLHLRHLAERIENNVLDDRQYDYGNKCLLQLLGFSARELSNLGGAGEPLPNDSNALKAYRDQLDRRQYQLNAASIRLTNEIRGVWHPDQSRAEADRLKIQADGQYLKVVVEDDLGVDIEMDQRSHGYQWLVSFFVIFFAEAMDRHQNAILLLDEPGLSLHGLKQREFRSTISKLAERNQTIYTTHSPFLVGPDELDLVRVVEMTNRATGTRIHTAVTAGDTAALLPLQEALGYDLAQSLFAQKRNLVLEGLTDYWYVEATAELLRDAELADLNGRIAMLPAEGAGKVAYFATILHANNLKVAALLDSDASGDNAAQQETLIHTLGNKNILRTKDAYTGPVSRPEVEDMLRDTLIGVAKTELSWDIASTAASQPGRAIVDIFSQQISNFSKYRLAKAYLRWTRTHTARDLTVTEQNQWRTLIAAINKALK